MGYQPALFTPFPDNNISPDKLLSLAMELANNALGSPASTAWPTASKAIYVPFVIARPLTVYQVGWVNGAATVSGTREVGVYDAGGTKIVSGSATGSGASVMQRVDITDTVINPGQYWLAAVENGTANWFAWAPTAPLAAAFGVLTQTTASPLPATATFALDNTNAFIPLAFLQCRSTL